MRDLRWFSLVLAGTLCASAATVGETDRYLPLIHNGGGWTTQVTVVNLADTDAQLFISFLTTSGLREDWNIELKASLGLVKGPFVEATLPPGGKLTIDSSGNGDALKRGYAKIDVLNRVRVGASAELRRTTSTGTADRIVIPFCPELEWRSTMPLRLDGNADAELIWISGNMSAILDLVFRDDAGKIAYQDSLTFGPEAQLFVSARKQWPHLQGFRGTIEWKVSFPGADIYEDLVLAGISLASSGDGPVGVLQGMTLPEFQGRSARH